MSIELIKVTDDNYTVEVNSRYFTSIKKFPTERENEFKKRVGSWKKHIVQELQKKHSI